MHECNKCLGTGETIEMKGRVMHNKPCDICEGKGEVESVINDAFINEKLF